MTSANHEFLDAREAAAFLGLNEQTIRRLSRDGEVPAFKVGGVWRYQKAHLRKWAAVQMQPATPRRRPRRSILVIDDEPAMAPMIGRMLGAGRYEVLAAGDGRAGLKVLTATRPDLVFLDLMMPGMLGPEVLREIRAIDADMPVVILTAYPDSRLMQEALRYSPIMLLSKPFSRNQLVQTIHFAINQTAQGHRRAAVA